MGRDISADEHQRLNYNYADFTDRAWWQLPSSWLPEAGFALRARSRSFSIYLAASRRSEGAPATIYTFIHIRRPPAISRRAGTRYATLPPCSRGDGFLSWCRRRSFAA
jgi:hypothetical protein